MCVLTGKAVVYGEKEQVMEVAPPSLARIMMFPCWLVREVSLADVIVRSSEGTIPSRWAGTGKYIVPIEYME